MINVDKWPFLEHAIVKICWLDNTPVGKVKTYDPETGLVTVGWLGIDGVTETFESDESPDDLEMLSDAPYIVEWKEYGNNRIFSTTVLAKSPDAAHDIVGERLQKRRILYSNVAAYRTVIFD